MSDSRPIHTYQARMTVSGNTDHQLLGSCAELFSRLLHTLFADFCAGKVLGSLKNEYLKRFGITARYFNAARVELEGCIASAKELQKLQVVSLQQSIALVEKKITRLKGKKNIVAKRSLYRKRHRHSKLLSKLKKLKNTIEKGIVRICFGGKKLFHQQHQKEQTTWKEEWKEARNSGFFTLGSKDETAGNQTCTATVAEDGSLSLRLRLPDALITKGKYLEFHDVWFPYGHDHVVQALRECELRKERKRQGDSSYKEHGQAISFRFKRDQKGWRIFASTQLPPFKEVSDERLGAIGVDVNADHLAATEIDHYGNPIQTKTIPLCLYGKSKKQAQALIGDACAQLVAFAVERKKSLVVENLDFTQKKATLHQLQPKLARCLSSFSYRAILNTISSRSYREGIRVHSVNPAFTSFLGRIKYAHRYGLTVHQAAALCIARRGKNYSESLSSRLLVPDSKGAHISLSVPVRNRKEKEWVYLKKVAKKLKEALVEHFRAMKNRSTGPPTVSCDGNPLGSCG